MDFHSKQIQMYSHKVNNAANTQSHAHNAESKQNMSPLK